MDFRDLPVNSEFTFFKENDPGENPVLVKVDAEHYKIKGTESYSYVPYAGRFPVFPVIGPKTYCITGIVFEKKREIVITIDSDVIMNLNRASQILQLLFPCFGRHDELTIELIS
jgi:hypothetical protein